MQLNATAGIQTQAMPFRVSLFFFSRSFVDYHADLEPSDLLPILERASPIARGTEATTEARRESKIPWSWRYSGCDPPGCWELNASPLEKQYVLVSSEP